jgi:hrcA: heat-inducible transcription repressor HrcA
MEEVLNERKQKYLKAIIKTYMETGEPVGSRPFPSMRILM